jgi:transporter family-2 protein
MSGGTAFAVTICVAGGLGGPVQAAVMGRFGDRIGIAQALAFATLLTAAISATALLVVRGSLHGYVAGLRSPLWLWSAAAMSALIVFAVTFSAPRIGTTATIGIFIAGNLVMAAAIDRYGLFGVARIPLTWPRLLGVVLVAAGAGLTLLRT